MLWGVLGARTHDSRVRRCPGVIAIVGAVCHMTRAYDTTGI
jgi:hypothetical protein